MVDPLIITFVRKQCEIVFHSIGFLICALLIVAAVMRSAAARNTVVIRDVTVIDGTGEPAQPAMTVVIDDGKIIQLESASISNEPPGADVIDGAGKYLVPGFIDSNVHASIYGNSTRRETVVKYGERNNELALEFAQRQLMHGVTTVRDSYGALVPLMDVRDRIDRGEVVGSRMLVAGNIVGWGGPFSMTFSLMAESDLTLFQAEWNDWIAQGVGEELMDMGPAEVRVAINQYLDEGPDFIKYGGTSHFSTPSLIGFSPRVQKVIVDETHKRGLIAETHSTSPEALRMSVEAGIDLIQHPEILSREYPEDLLQLIIERDVLCAIRSNTLAGNIWQDHLAEKKLNAASLQGAAAPKTSAEKRRRENLLNLSYEVQRRNAERLIGAGCRVTIATDNYQGRAPEFRKVIKPENHEAGIGSIMAIEGLVELGMTEMEAIVAATRNGAIAAGMLDSLGTIEVGKEADLVLLRENPLADIRNIRSIDNVVARGRIVDLAALPENRIFYRGPGWVPEITVGGRVGEAAAPAVAAEDSVSVNDGSGSESTERSGLSIEVLRDNLAVAGVSQLPLGNLSIVMESSQQWWEVDSDNTRITLPSDRYGLTADIRWAILGSDSMSLGESKGSIKVSRIK
jgi:imidazolonepropionase-like amidohydrolase